MTTTKLPTNERPMILDLDMAAAVEKILMPYSGKTLEKAQGAVRRVANSGVQGPFDTVLAAYQSAVQAVVGKEVSDG
jgi:hypothetical protein